MENGEELKKVQFKAGVKEGKELMRLEVVVKLSKIQEAMKELALLVESH